MVPKVYAIFINKAVWSGLILSISACPLSYTCHEFPSIGPGPDGGE
jgi:hypothetical protein